MRISDFDLYRDLLKRESGLIITPDKSYVLDSRLTPVARKWGYISLDSMTMALRAVPEEALISDVVEAMTYSDTSFYRDREMFETFSESVLPYLLKNRKKKHNLQIWSATCSTGQEPYSIAMALNEKKEELKNWSFEILGTDLSKKSLKRADIGIYSQFEVQRGLPIRSLMRHFKKSNDSWQIKKELRDMLHLEQFNLLDKMNALGTFDVIFCCNVLSNFDKETRKSVLENISGCLVDDGFLFISDKAVNLDVTDALMPLEGYNNLYVRSDAKIKNFKPLLKRAYA